MMQGEPLGAIWPAQNRMAVDYNVQDANVA